MCLASFFNLGGPDLIVLALILLMLGGPLVVVLTILRITERRGSTPPPLQKPSDPSVPETSEDP